MTAKKEHRCAVCGALLNVEPCVDGIHGRFEAKINERKRIVAAIRGLISGQGGMISVERLHDFAKQIERDT